MKRTALARKSSMRRTPMRKARPKPRNTADTVYLVWLRTQPCCAPGEPCRRPSEVHHPRQYAGGTALRGPDATAIPLCNADHVHGLHKLTGRFKGWTRERLQAWERERVDEHRRRYERATSEAEGTGGRGASALASDF